MPTRPTGVASPPPTPAIERDLVTPHRTANTPSQYHLLLLRYQITALEMELECERQRRQEIIDRYERLLAER
ncbi:hypothetical protein [Haloarcula amylovorans]|uniref:hypothetical protein n=1 Tax=Haloarcula amylovorans TaxID=2562280 RepID=UPI0010768BEA|nr:hypothetical protein [Halomicroarcula amylolytica]